MSGQLQLQAHVYGLCIITNETYSKNTDQMRKQFFFPLVLINPKTRDNVFTEEMTMRKQRRNHTIFVLLKNKKTETTQTQKQKPYGFSMSPPPKI